MEKVGEDKLKADALEYHSGISHGKYEIFPSKPMNDQRDLSLAYSPGVAYPCIEIKNDIQTSFKYTNRANTVGIFTNGTAVLGLGSIGVLAAKPAMEGIAVLMKHCGDVDALDVGVDTKDVDEFVKTVSLLEPSFGAILLQDIKGPECFKIEEDLQKAMGIPVMHSNQHSTACIIVAALINATEITKKDMKDIKVVISGAGASGYAVATLLPEYKVLHDNIIAVDSKGVIYKGREDNMNKYKEKIAADTTHRTLEDAIKDADVFIGVSTSNVLSADMLKSMAKDPIVFAMANPNPEIKPELAHETRDDVIMATGRSDYPNQVLDAMVYPFIFRGALDVGAKFINMEMKKAAIESLVELAHKEVTQGVKDAYKRDHMEFGKEYLIPTPFDSRLLVPVSYAVAKAAVDSGNSTKTPGDWEEYKKHLQVRVDAKIKAIAKKVEQDKEDYEQVGKLVRKNTIGI
jgi:malate dehydrogenase (oxaloacetate-decarboxylating)(NADP+)